MSLASNGAWRAFWNLGLRVANAGFALLAILLLRKVAPISDAADFVLALIIIAIAVQLVAVPIGQDLIRAFASGNPSSGFAAHLRVAFLRALVAVAAIWVFGVLAAERLFPTRPELGLLLTMLLPTVITGTISLVLGHGYAARKNMLGFLVGQGMVNNLLSCSYLGAIWAGVGPQRFDAHIYLGLLVFTGAAVACGMILHQRFSQLGAQADSDRAPSPAWHIRSGALFSATALNTLVQQAPTLLIGMLSDATFVVQFYIIQRFAAQFALISSSVSIQFVPDMMAAFAASQPETSAGQVLARYRSVNLGFGLAAVLAYAALCVTFLYLVTDAALWPTTMLIVAFLFIPSGFAAICGIAGPTLVAARREWVLSLAFGANLGLIGLAFAANALLSPVGVVAAFGAAQLAAVAIQYFYIRRYLHLDILLGPRT
ncbi:hypothetical protein [Phaeovulum sp.]|uniref:hypothetical protein n=1 Tax=Phaeovulum sp. TaxID=2934796 RepID=UPI0035666F6F